jgi:tetratricopeptide (TPR) repeat protein
MKMHYDDLLKIKSLADFDEADRLSILGQLIDLSSDEKNNQGIDLALQLASEMDAATLSEHDQVLLHYNIANAWSAKRHFKSENLEGAWDFNMEEVSKEIFHLRKAVTMPGFSTIRKERRSQVFTNLGNALSFVGRFSEAQQLWNNAVETTPGHGLALTNKAKGLYHYGLYLFDEEHTKIFIIVSFHLIKSALENKHEIFEGYRESIEEFYASLLKCIPEKLRGSMLNLNTYDLGNNKNLIDYRRWCLNNQLYINPLNDIGNVSIASHDALNLPTMYFSGKTPPVFISLYNQLKQEYGTARYLYYEAVTSTSPHISDTDIVVLDTMESTIYSASVEKAKIAFRVCYSIFDKIAFFLNQYLQLGVDETKINFRTIWYDNPSKRILKSQFISSQNWALRGLFWLSKDIHWSWENGDIVIEPEAREIAAIRNHIEHKFLKVVKDKALASFFYDETKDISFSISKKDFSAKVEKILKLCRASLIYLSLAVNDVERRKPKPLGPTLPILPTIIPLYNKF